MMWYLDCHCFFLVSVVVTVVLAVVVTMVSVEMVKFIRMNIMDKVDDLFLNFKLFSK